MILKKKSAKYYTWKRENTCKEQHG